MWHKRRRPPREPAPAALSQAQQAAGERDFLQATLDSLSAHIAVLGEQGEILMTNHAWRRFAVENGAAPDELGDNYLAACDSAPDDEFAARAGAELRSVLAGQASEFVLEYPCHAPAAERWFTLRGARFEGQGAARVVVAHDDVSERVAAEAALRTAGNYMRAVADSIGEGLFTLDTEGRVIYLNQTAERLLGWSGDELKGCLLHPIAHRLRPDGTELPVEESAILHARRDGVVRHVDDDVFIRRNGQAFPVAYTAAPFETEDGVQGCVVVFEDISERKADQERLRAKAEALAWIERVQDALAQDRFVLHAQPIVDLRTGEVVQRELLLRLREPGGATVGPGPYLHIAEQYGLIGDIDRWVIAKGAQIAATGLPVEINISARSIGDPAVLDHIERCLEHSAVDPTLLVFELTETAIVADQAAALAFAERLHELGCKLALDDFGTGYGGFTYLKQLPVDYLKIDIEFVRDLATNPGSRHVVEAVVALARGFGLQTVAEGVEDAEAYAMLIELGVDFAQGYHIARPGPMAEPVRSAA